MNTLKLREVSNLSASPHSRPPQDGLSSVRWYSGFLISPSSDKLLIKRALPRIPPLSLLPLPGDPREAFKVDAARQGLRVSSMRRRVGSLAGAHFLEPEFRTAELRSLAWELQPGHQQLSLPEVEQRVWDCEWWSEIIGYSGMEKGSFRENSFIPLLPSPLPIFVCLFKDSSQTPDFCGESSGGCLDPFSFISCRPQVEPGLVSQEEDSERLYALINPHSRVISVGDYLSSDTEKLRAHAS